MSSDLPTPRSPADTYAAAVKFYGRHLVCLGGTYVYLDERGRQVGEEKIFTISGFIMSFGGEWFFITAGHALKEGIDDTLASGRVRLHAVGFHDALGPDAKFPHPTMIDYPSAPKWYIDDRNLGLDIGLIYLRPLYRAGLQANGVVPITEANWVNQPADLGRDYFLFGIPECLNGPARVAPGVTGESVTARINPLLLHVERTDTPHRELPPSTVPRFIGRVNTATFGLESIVGMSGGPIFGFRTLPDGSCQYWVVAIQSWWDPDTRTVYGCPVPIVAGLIADWLERVTSDSKG
jgi:hypothetical protein